MRKRSFSTKKKPLKILILYFKISIKGILSKEVCPIYDFDDIFCNEIQKITIIVTYWLIKFKAKSSPQKLFY